MAPAGDLHGSSTPHPVSYYVATLDQVENTARYIGPISGIVNERTRAAIQHWLHNRYRCPVVIEAWRNLPNGTRTTLWAGGVNIWKYDEITSAAPRMFFRDFTKYYTYPEQKETQRNEYHVFGTWSNYTGFGGPGNGPKHAWAETEPMPEILGMGITYENMINNPDSSMASTFRVARSIAEQECMGFFDSINAYDDAYVSIGPYHWTFGRVPANTASLSQDQLDRIKGELSGFLAYVLHDYPDIYRKAYGNFGLYPDKTWRPRNPASPRGQGNPLWAGTQRKYEGWYRQHTEGIAPTTVNLNQLPLVEKKRDEVHYFQSWHWVYRWVMSGRCFPRVWLAMWNMMRMRMQDVSERSVNITVGNIHINASVSQIFTSEKAIALLTRWHVYRPNHVTGDRLNTLIREAIIQNPAIPWVLPVQQWTDEHEECLTQKVLAAANAVNSTHTATANWPNYAGRSGRHYRVGTELGGIRGARNSFLFYSEGI
jgi:hypothetical protein